MRRWMRDFILYKEPEFAVTLFLLSLLIIPALLLFVIVPLFRVPVDAVPSLSAIVIAFLALVVPGFIHDHLSRRR